MSKLRAIETLIVEIKRKWRSFSGDQSGATAIEYALLAALAAISAMSGLIVFGDNADAMYNSVIDAINAALV